MRFNASRKRVGLPCWAHQVRHYTEPSLVRGSGPNIPVRSLAVARDALQRIAQTRRLALVRGSGPNIRVRSLAVARQRSWLENLDWQLSSVRGKMGLPHGRFLRRSAFAQSGGFPMGENDKPDFSNVQGGSTTTAPAPAKPDFSNVQAGSTSTAAIEPTTYTVVSGDSLSKIAKKFYGHANRWHAIYDANRDQISDPDRIRIGQVLKIPNIDKQEDTHA
jgi:hypothetical protein